MQKPLGFLKRFRLLITILVTVAIPVFFSHCFSIEVKAFFYSLSLSMKSVLVFILPFIIFSYVFSSLLNHPHGAFSFVLLLLGCVFLSNLLALNSSYLALHLGHHLLSLSETSREVIKPLPVLWHFSIKPLFPNQVSLVVGFMLGIIFSKFPNNSVNAFAFKLRSFASRFLMTCFIPVLPVFILGFVFKLEHDQVLQQSMGLYSKVFLLVLMTQLTLLLFWYAFAAGFNRFRFFCFLKNVLPASITGLTTISSAASMPVLLSATAVNMQDKQQSELIVPSIINIHTIGSAVSVMTLSLVTIMNFHLPFPSYATFLPFSILAALAMFAVAAVPGGVVIVLSPLMEAHMGFSHEMVGLLTALCLIFDPVATAVNVTANGAFPILFKRIYEHLRKLDVKKESLDLNVVKE
jgi:Na+/H+-dicarboxylate symporter